MAKTKKTSAKQNSNKRARAKNTAIVPSTGLDAQAAGYARLLADPCNAPLVHPVYPGGDAGYLFRAESFSTFGVGAAETSGIIHWAPGYNNVSGSQLVGFAAANADTATAVASQGASSPGNTFLQANAKGVRCVAACLKITFPGSEANRAGRIHYGHTSAGMLDIGNSVKVDSVAQTLQHFSRTPTDTIELVWKPSQGDFEFNDPTETSGALIRDRKGAVTVAWAGLPAATGLTFHFTAIYEWTPATALGIGHNALGKNQSRNTFDQVLDRLIAGGFNFVKHAGHAVGSALGRSMVSGISQTFGIMPAVGRSRNLLTMR